jgi:membrane protease YdiL (CAAX protease family)
MTIHWFDHLLFALFALIFPIFETFEMRKIKARILAGEESMRAKLYRSVIWKEWSLAAIVLAIWWWLGRGAGSLGLIPRTDGLAWFGHGVAVLICLLLIAQLRGFAKNPETLEAHAETVTNLKFMAPHTTDERQLFDYVSVTAGVCEELIYRGFVIAYMTTALGMSFLVAAILSSVIFGVAHSYQGVGGVLKTTAIGLVLALLYGLTGALWASIIVHAMVDITSGRLLHVAIGSRPDEKVSEAPAA